MIKKLISTRLTFKNAIYCGFLNRVAYMMNNTYKY